MPVFPSLEWLHAVQEIANSDEEFLATCRRWPNEAVIVVVEEDDAYEETRCFFLSGDETGLTTVEEIDSPLDAEALFTITAPYTTWKEALQAGDKSVQYIMRGKFEVEGDKEELIRRAKESRGLLRLFEEVETTFDV